MKANAVKLLGISISALLAVSAQAQSSIDTTALWNGVNYIDSWGASSTDTYGQTFTPTGGNYSTSTSTTSYPHFANTWAMPFPMVPAPTTQTL